MALKPDKLSFDPNLRSEKRWKQRFRAFHASSNLRVLPLTDQQAFLIACIDDEVANRINGMVSETTPMFPNAGGIPCCFDIINGPYKEKIPIPLRRVQFMCHKHQGGQDGIAWREELRNLSDNANIDRMSTTDLLSAIYVTGICSNDLCEKLLEMNNPTIETFDWVVDSFDQAMQVGVDEATSHHFPEEGEGQSTNHLETTVKNRGNGQRQETTQYICDSILWASDLCRLQAGV